MTTSFCSSSFGCRVNHAEKEQIDKKLQETGYTFSQSNPDFFIINSCAVTAKAERETRQFIYQIRKKFPHTKIVLTGCAATLWKQNGTNNVKVDLLIDNTNKNSLPRLLSQHPQSLSPRRSFSEGGPDKYLRSKRAIIKIQDGCHRFCTYCIVPHLRGLPESSTIKNIVSEVKQIENDANEVILTAINTEAYGKDTGENFINLISAILSRTKVKRLSFGSIHPWSINKDFISAYKAFNRAQRFVNFFHVPLQSGSDKILNLMKRGYKRQEIAEKINALYQINPDILFGTDIIVGFPGETDKDFNDTYEFLDNSPISKFHLFRYSKRENTAAFFLSQTVKEPDSETKKKRLKILQDLGNKKYSRFLGQLLNKTIPAMFIRSVAPNLQEGLLMNQTPVFVSSHKDYVGKIANVKIERLSKGKLFGRIV